VILRAVLGTAETGVYSAAARIMEILHSLPLMLTASLSPGLVAARARGAGDYEQRVRRLFQLAAGSAWGAALGCALLAPWVVPWVFGPAFARTADMVAILAGSLPFIALGVARQEYLINEGRQRFQLATTLVGAVLNVLLNLWAIPRWGGLGAAAATVVSHLAADLLTSLAWPPTRGIGVWQLQALVMFWRPLPAARTALPAP
jgi:PST family polysaccharide transporter